MMSGEILGERYQIQQQLGKKAGRRTFLAQDISTGASVVIKLLSWGSDFQWDDLKLFEREAATLKSLSHPAIPRYLNYFEVKSPQYKGFALVQTYIPFPTLEQYIHSGRTFTEAEVKEIAKAVLEILIYLHSLNPPVIHRDLKPSNILLGERSGNSVGKVYLVDFGSVQTVLATEGGTKTIVGTYGYMPQEQFGDRAVPASDLYSLGATLIYLVTGTHPADLPQKDFRIQFEQIANLSPDFTDWLKSMIKPSLNERLQSAKEALKNLDILENLPNSPHYYFYNCPIFGSKIKYMKTQKTFKIFIKKPNYLQAIFYLILSVIEGLFKTYLFTLFSLAFLAFIFIGLYFIISMITTYTPIFNFLAIVVYFCLFGKQIIDFIKSYKLLIINLFGSPIEFNINEEIIYCQTDVLNRRYYYINPLPREKITFIVYKGKHFVKGAEAGKIIEVQAQLKIYIDDRAFYFPNIYSERELQWLANQLSDWLGIPITEPKFKDEVKMKNTY